MISTSNTNSRQMRNAKPQAVRCAVYTRKSTDEGLEQEFNSLDAQRESGEAFVASQRHEGWVCLPRYYDDGGFSGGNLDRPALRQLLADVEAGQIDCIVVYKVDRLSRSLMDFARMMEVFERHGVSFVSVTQQFNTSTPMGRLVLNVLLSFAQFEREIIGERIRDKIAAQRRKGKWAGGTPVLGYDVDRSGNSPKLVINAEEAKQVREIFELYLACGSLLPVVEELASRGWCNKSWLTKKGERRGGRPFDKGSLYALLTNPLYVGQIRHKEDVYAGEHEPILSTETFRQVQERLQQNGRNGGTEVRNKHSALLRGLLHCRACERAMTHTFTNKGNKRYRYYTCTRAIQNGRNTCPSRSLPAAEIEQAVLGEIRCIADDAGLRGEVFHQARTLATAELDDLRREQADLNRELARHHAEVRQLAVSGQNTAAGGSLGATAPLGSESGSGSSVQTPRGAAATTARIADLHDRITRAETRLAELRERIAEVERQEIEESEVDAAFAKFDELWSALTPREQAHVLSLLVARIEFDADEESITIQFQPSAIKSLAAGDYA